MTRNRFFQGCQHPTWTKADKFTWKSPKLDIQVWRISWKKIDEGGRGRDWSGAKKNYLKIWWSYLWFAAIVFWTAGSKRPETAAERHYVLKDFLSSMIRHFFSKYNSAFSCTLWLKGKYNLFWICECKLIRNSYISMWLYWQNGTRVNVNDKYLVPVIVNGPPQWGPTILDLNTWLKWVKCTIIFVLVEIENRNQLIIQVASHSHVRL